MNGDSAFTHWYDNTTVIHPVGLSVLMALAVLVLVLPRRYAILPLFVLACFIPAAQRIVIGGLDFTFLRVLVLFGMIRVLARGEAQGFRITPLDVAFVAWVLIGAAVFVTRVGTGAAFVNQLGVAFDALGIFFVCRFLIRSWDDLAMLAYGATIVALPTAVFFLYEFSTGNNLFSVFGGVPELTVIRNGRLRYQGAFSHPILAGCFWASFLPLIASRWWLPGTNRALVVLGVVSALVIIVTSASSTPLIGVGVCLVGAAFFPIRRYLRWLLWGGVAMLVSLHIVMEKPVWHLISRIDLAGGSTGWHRYNLIDQFARNFDEWWLMGTSSTAHWGHQLQDTANVYVSQGVRGGAITLILFVTVIALAFRQVGMILRSTRRDFRKTIIAWAIGVSLTVHSTVMIGTSYFGQILFAFFSIFGVVASLRTAAVSRAVRRRKGAKRQ